jgi:hypothetical protein
VAERMNPIRVRSPFHDDGDVMTRHCWTLTAQWYMPSHGGAHTRTSAPSVRSSWDASRKWPHSSRDSCGNADGSGRCRQNGSGRYRRRPGGDGTDGAQPRRRPGRLHARRRGHGGQQGTEVVEDDGAVAEQGPALFGMRRQVARREPVGCRHVRTSRIVGYTWQWISLRVNGTGAWPRHMRRYR